MRIDAANVTDTIHDGKHRQAVPIRMIRKGGFSDEENSGVRTCGGSRRGSGRNNVRGGESVQ